MKIVKKIELGEYTIELEYEDTNGKLDIIVYDELDSVIDMISVTNDEDEDDQPLKEDINPNLN